MTTPFDRLPEPDAVAEVFGAEATAEEAYGLLTVDVPAASWTDALRAARDTLGCTFFDWLSAVDEGGSGFRVCAHVVAPAVGSVRRLMIRTTVPHAAPALPTAVGVYAGAAWHERETHEMFGVDFTGHPHLVPLLLPEGFEGHPLRKDFVLAARVAKAWPGAKEPGESDHGGPKRRQMLPPGVPDPNDWGPMKGQLPPAPARPARTPRAAGAAGAAGAAERPARRTRSVSEGSASQGAAGAPAAPAAARRTRSASDGPAGLTGAAETPAAPAAPATAEAPAAPGTSPRKRTPDAPWDVPRDIGPAAAAPAAEPGATKPGEPAPPAEDGTGEPAPPAEDGTGEPAPPAEDGTGEPAESSPDGSPATAPDSSGNDDAEEGGSTS
ncbi:NADH-quinone oxidoreductase subunit C [Actinacidiphila glaucinigra]|uniref:NADH-quinone oxidoreductase subunit C n=1 Tax=Actinacidiphila glaucinigra TaxID=235986 RepID=UPI00372000AB